MYQNMVGLLICDATNWTDVYKSNPVSTSELKYCKESLIGSNYKNLQDCNVTFFPASFVCDATESGLLAQTELSQVKIKSSEHENPYKIQDQNTSTL